MKTKLIIFGLLISCAGFSQVYSLDHPDSVKYITYPQVYDLDKLYFQASVSAGADDTITAGQTYQLAGTKAYMDSVVWTTSGTGMFDDDNSLTATYTPSAADIAAGSVTLTLTGYVNGLSTTDGNNLTIYGFWDTYSDNRAAGAINGTPAIPGIGDRTVVDTENKITQSGGKLVFAGGKTVAAYTDPKLNYPAIARSAGKALCFTITLPAIDKHVRLGLATNATDINGDAIIHFNSSASITAFSSSTVNTAAATYDATTYQVAIVLRTVGAMWYIKGGAFTDWTLLWISETGNAASLVPVIYNHSSAITVDDWKIVNLTPLAMTDSVKTVNAGDSITTNYDSFIEYTWTAATNDTLEISFRYTDDDNRWIIRCDQANSTIKVIEKMFGVEVERNSVAQTWTNGTAYRISIRNYDELIKTYVAGVAKNTYTFAFNNKYIGKAKVNLAGTNLISWPILFDGNSYPVSVKPSVTYTYRYNTHLTPVIAKRAGKWDAFGTREICILKDESGNVVYDDDNKMTSFYWGRATSSGVPQIGIAKSLDGVTWDGRLDAPVIAANTTVNGSWYENGVLAASAIMRSADSVIMLLATGWGDSYTSFGIFTSADSGSTWVDGGAKINTNAFKNEDESALVGMGVPDVIKKSSGGYICLFEGRNVSGDNDWRIFAMESTDFTGTWTAMNTGHPVLLPSASDWDNDGVANPHLIEQSDGNYLMIYNGIPLSGYGWRIGIATSTDLINWTRYADNPILHKGDNTWDATQVETAGIIKDLWPDKLYYQGYSATGAHEIGLAESY